MGEANTDLVSIVIPAYNAEKYLEETVASSIIQIPPLFPALSKGNGWQLTVTLTDLHG